MHKTCHQFQLPQLAHPTRLSDIPIPLLPQINSKSAWKKLLKAQKILVNDSKGVSGQFVHGNEQITILTDISFKPSIELPLEVLYEDDHIAFVNKPAGIEVSGNKKYTLENALTHNLTPSSQADALKYPQAIHRLDYPTTGVLFIGKTSSAVHLSNQLFENHNIQKTYLAISIGAMDDNGEIHQPIDQKPSHSSFKVLKTVTSNRFQHLNLVQLHPHTGRKHQLRKHLAFINSPILGDKQYGVEPLILKGKGLYLHAYTLSFTHPFTAEKITITAPIPEKFIKIFPELVNF